MNIKIKKLDPMAKMPSYGSADAACFDLYSSCSAKWTPIYVNTNIVGYEAIIKTGLSFEIPKGYRMDIYPRSGWGFNYNIQLANGTGKIDSDYRGEVLVKLIAFCTKSKLPEINGGIPALSRIAQAEINKVTDVKFEFIEELSETERGSGGFGSTGVHNDT